MFLDETAPYALIQSEKERFLTEKLDELVRWHDERCPEYHRLLEGLHVERPLPSVDALPYIPASVFKHFDLRSVPEGTEVTVIKSSSTSSGTPSKIYVDGESADLQKRSITAIFSDYIGACRRPYIVFDAMSTVRGKKSFSARGAAIMSLMPYASKFFFVMDEVNGDLRLNIERLLEAVAYVREHGGEFIAYGFTFILYQAHQQLAEAGLRFTDLSLSSRIIHSGGWKRLTHLSVDKQTFNQFISSVWSLESSNVIDFYGLVEQVGVVYPDCSAGNKHVPYWADVIIRDPNTLRPLAQGGQGLIQLLSLLPRGGPSHSVITDDLGEIVAVDNCPCGRKGKAFLFRGRAPRVEVRGCSDIFAGDAGANAGS